MSYEFRFDTVLRHWDLLAQGLLYTILISIATLVLSSILGMVVAVIRLRRIRVLSPILGLYVEFFRGTPPLVQLVWIYYCLPIIFNVNLPDVVSVTLAMSLYTAAFLAEVFRAGIQGIDKGQTHAALAVGMTNRQAMRRIVIPQATYRMIPAIGNVFVTTIKLSSLCSVLGFPELMYQGQHIQQVYFRPIEALTVVALLYFAVTWSTSQGLSYLERRLAWEKRTPRAGRKDQQIQRYEAPEA